MKKLVIDLENRSQREFDEQRLMDLAEKILRRHGIDEG